MKIQMKRTKIAMLAFATSLLFAGVATAAEPRSATYDKHKICSNDTHSIDVTYDYLDYANGSGNKIIIAKGFQVTSGPAVAVLGAPYSTLNKSGFTLVVGSTVPQTVIIDVVNGGNNFDFNNPDLYSVISNCVLN
jgi:hypothetical protein